MTIANAPTSQVSTPTNSRGAALVSVCGKRLPLRETKLSAAAQGGIARVRLTQRFLNESAEPLRVTYLLPLPEKAAVSGFSFELDGRVTRGRVKAREQARAAFEEALIEGRSAAILEEESSTLFRQEVGNVPPGAEIVVSIEVDQKLGWLAASGAWEWRFPTVVAPRFQGASVPDEEVRRTTVSIADLPEGDHLSPRAHLDLLVLDCLSGPVESPSHRVASHDEPHSDRSRVSFQSETSDAATGAALDRDIVIRWPVATEAPGVSLSLERTTVGNEEALFGLLAIVPPTVPQRTVPRDLIVLLDTSGSMSGEPLDQAVHVASALVDSLGDDDRLELMEFSSSVSRWKRGPRRATPKRRASAKRWLRSLSASGSTHMHDAILESLRLLGPESQRQVLLVTDGLIGGERQLVVDLAAKLPRACRVHTLGIGHGVNRTLTAGAARAGRGVEQIVAPGEDPTQATLELLASMAQPVVVDLQIDGSALLECSSAAFDVYAATPSLVPVRLRADRDGNPLGILEVEGRTAEGVWRRTLDIADVAAASTGANATLFGRARVEQLETFDSEQRSSAMLDAEIERLGVTFQIATRRTSWVAISENATVDPSSPTRTVEMPHELTAGLCAEGLGLRASSTVAPAEAIAARAPRGQRPTLSKPRSKFATKKSRHLGRAAERFESKLRQDSPAPQDLGREDSFEEGFSDDDVAPPVLELIARVLVLTDGRLVIEFSAPQDLTWIDVGPITVEFEDGSTKVVELMTPGSTLGAVPKGMAMRMVLTGPFGSTAASAVQVHVEGPIKLQLTLQK